MEVSLSELSRDKLEDLQEVLISPEVQHELIQLKLPVGFGVALIALKAGKRVTRQGWNGKGMFIYHVPANRYPPTTRAGYDLASGPDFCVPYRAYVAMKTVDGDVVPWVCSQSDLLEEDWLILE